MANTLTNVSSEMVQDEILPALKLGLIPLGAVSWDVDTTGTKGVGDKVKVGIVGSRTAAPLGASFESGDSTVSTQEVALEVPTVASWYVDPYREGLPTIERFLKQGREAAYAVAKLVLQDTLGLYVGANIGAVANTDTLVVSKANYDSDNQATLWEMLKGKGVTGPVSAIHSIGYTASLFKDVDLKDRSASGSDVLQTGELPAILGARQFYTDAFPSAVTTENTEVIYTGRSTAGVAFAAPNPEILEQENQAGVRNITVIDPETGIPLTYRTWVNTSTGHYWGAVYVMKGQAFIQNAAVRVINS